MNQIQEFEMCRVNIHTDTVNGITTYSTSVDVDRLKPYNRDGITRRSYLKLS